jgi:hypothetical protein
VGSNFHMSIPIIALTLHSNGWAQTKLDVLPVVNRANVHKLEGIVTLRGVLDSYGVTETGSGIPIT